MNTYEQDCLAEIIFAIFMSIVFGFWQYNFWAGLFCFLLIVFIKGSEPPVTLTHKYQCTKCMEQQTIKDQFENECI